MQESKIIQVDYEGLRSLVDAFAENADVFNRLDFLWDDTARKETHFLVLSETSKIVAAGSVLVPHADLDELWLTHISVDPEYKRQGHGTAILKSIFDYAAKSDYILAPSSFEEEGFKCLAHVMSRLHRDYPDLKIRYRTLSGGSVDGTQPYALVKSTGRNLQIQKL